MASSYSTDLKLELMVTGENAGTWGDKTNTNLNLIQQAIAGYESINVAASDVTLVMSNATLSNARNMILNLSGSLTGNRNVLVPDGIEKFYIVRDQTTRNGYTLTIKTVSGTGFAIETSGQLAACYSDGTNVTEISLNTLTGTIATAQIDNLAITSAKLASFAVTSARIASFAVTSTRLATDAVTAVKIAQSTITQSKLAANSVGSNQLISTGVTASTYTAATIITVDADGRITSASSGSAGAGMGITILAANGPASGTLTASPTANRLAVYAWSGGGGGGGGRGQNYGNEGGDGAAGVYGFYNVPITQPWSKTYSAGGPGSAGSAGMSGQAGGAGGTTNITNVFTMNGGNGGAAAPMGMKGPDGTPGSASPAATYAFPMRAFLIGSPNASAAGNRGSSNGDQGGNPGNAGGTGGLIVFENSGT